MPELPEVETVRRSLLSLLPHKKISEVEIFTPTLLAAGDAAAFAALAGHEFTDFWRRGKYLLFGFDNAERLVVHLRMTGKLLYHPVAEKRHKHDHACFSFDDGSELVYNDTRKFGRFWLTDEAGLADVRGLSTLGLEPLDAEFSAAYLHAQLARHPKAKLKAVLLDQTVVAGLGNIYADEVLFRAGVHPERSAAGLTPAEEKRLTAAMREILTEAIASRGTTFRDYVDGNNQRGGYQEQLKVFQKQGEPCPDCGHIIERIRVAGRSSGFCPHCQQAK